MYQKKNRDSRAKFLIDCFLTFSSLLLSTLLKVPKMLVQLVAVLDETSSTLVAQAFNFMKNRICISSRLWLYHASNTNRPDNVYLSMFLGDSDYNAGLKIRRRSYP